MASGVIHRLVMAGFKVTALEQESPDCIRRPVCFAEAIYQKQIKVEQVEGLAVSSVTEAIELSDGETVPILIDSEARLIPELKPDILVDGRMFKRDSDCRIDMAPVVIGLGPGFVAGSNCHAVVETNRGHRLGRVIYHGAPESYTGRPADVGGNTYERLLLAPTTGIFKGNACIGEKVEVGQIVAKITAPAGEQSVTTRIGGVLRGLARDGLRVAADQKIGDVDPRGIKEHCFEISDKANAIAGGVLEAILAMQNRVE